MAYVYLLAAIAAEVFGTSLLRSTEGFTRLVPTATCLVAYAVSFAFMAQAVRSASVGILYALWSGLGTAAIVTIAVVFLDESFTVRSGVGMALIVVGAVLVNLDGVH